MLSGGVHINDGMTIHTSGLKIDLGGATVTAGGLNVVNGGTSITNTATSSSALTGEIIFFDKNMSILIFDPFLIFEPFSYF